MIYSFLLTLISASLVQAASPQTTILFLGDSLTEGYGVPGDKAYPTLVGEQLKKKNVKVINAGISGSTSASAPSRMTWALKAKPNWVVLALGANDGLRGLSTTEMKKNLLQAVKVAQSSGVKVMLVGMKVPPNFGATYGRNFEKVYRDIATANRALVFVPFLLERVGGEKEMNQSDGIHPNEKGHEVMASLIVRALEPHL